MHSCQNNFEKSYIGKKTKHTLSGYSIFTSCSFDPTRNKLDYYKGEYQMKGFCKYLREHAMNATNEKKEMIPLTDEENELDEMQNVCDICKKNIQY